MADANTPSYFDLTTGQNDELKSFMSRGDGFFQIKSTQVPSCVPGSLRAKWDSAMVVVSGSTTSTGAIMVLGYRPDHRAGLMDQDPFAVAVSGSAPYGGGVLLHHASYDSRSIVLPPEFTSSVMSSGLSNYYHSSPPFGASSGSLAELPTPVMSALRLVGSFLTQKSTGSNE